MGNFGCKNLALAGALLLLLNETVIPCSPVVGAPDMLPGAVDTALFVYGLGLLLLLIHVGVFVYRWRTKKRKSLWIFWATISLSVFAIPVVYLLIFFSVGMACGNGAIERAAYLPIFQLIALAAQLISWRFSNRPIPSPIPRS